jgi:hypothetical protein
MCGRARLSSDVSEIKLVFREAADLPCFSLRPPLVVASARPKLSHLGPVF